MTRAEYDNFMTWASQHLGQGYSLEVEEGSFVDPVTRWAYIAYKAGRKAAYAQMFKVSGPRAQDMDITPSTPFAGFE